MSINLINIIENKYMQAKQALLKYSLSFKNSLAEGNKTRKKIRKFNSLNAIMSYYENIIKPSTFVKGEAPSAITLKNLKIQAIFGGVHPLDMTEEDAGNTYGAIVGLSYAYMFGIMPLNLYTTDVYGNIVNIVNLTYGWPAQTSYNNIGINSLSEEFSGLNGAPAPTAISMSAIGLTHLEIIGHYPFSNTQASVDKYYLLLEKLKSNIVSSINSTSDIFGAEILNGDIVIKVINKQFYGAFNLQRVYSNQHSVSWDNAAVFAGGVSEVPETASYSSNQIKEILNRLDIIAAELGITYTSSEALNLNINNANNELIASTATPNIIDYAEGSLYTEDGEPLAAEQQPVAGSLTVPEDHPSFVDDISDTTEEGVSLLEGLVVDEGLIIDTSTTTNDSSGGIEGEGRSSYTSNTTTRSSSSSSGGGY